ncbi:uncharacterized protein LOC110727652 [Chenopodium quinoa]|uniref:uncharacterized protein LOC110727652 n=1 Tax=Chenopodium quinoa TaxID=63459 RepID=UPI000B76EC22|nr:uncharacterized protein LOC110727652 [Chenopodium quinoa]
MTSYSNIFLDTIVVIAFLGIIASINGDISVDMPVFAPERDDIKVRGTIFCVNNNDWNHWIPLQGARVEVYCPWFRIKSTVTDNEGFFLVDLPYKRFSDDCKVYLDSPGRGVHDCIFPTDTNNGTSGAPIAKSNEHPGLFEVGPFVYVNTL